MIKIVAPEPKFCQTAEGDNHCVSMDNKGPTLPASIGFSSIFVSCNESTNFVFTKLITSEDAETAADVLLKQWLFFLHRKY